MIQRIQTIYLLVVAILQTTLFFSTHATVINESTEELVTLSSNVQWALLIILSALIPLVTVFLFKKRRWQVRLSIINSLLLLALQIIFIVYLIDISKNNATVSYSISDVSPAISLILTILATRFILKDEMKIQSYNRIR
jgi:drug/metabolite transporter (DMT)-like permease